MPGPREMPSPMLLRYFYQSSVCTTSFAAFCGVVRSFERRDRDVFVCVRGSCTLECRTTGWAQQHWPAHKHTRNVFVFFGGSVSLANPRTCTHHCVRNVHAISGHTATYRRLCATTQTPAQHTGTAHQPKGSSNDERCVCASDAGAHVWSVAEIGVRTPAAIRQSPR